MLPTVDQFQGSKSNIEQNERTMLQTIPEINFNTAPLLPNKKNDPLRLLVIYSEDPKCDAEVLKQLAFAAANLSGIDKVSTKREVGVKVLAGIFAGTEEFVRKVEQTVKNTYSILDPSDSDGIGGNFIKYKKFFVNEKCQLLGTKILGQISRNRRAKSANKRLSAKLKEDKQKLMSSSDSSSVDTLNVEDSKASMDLECAEEKVNNTNELSTPREVTLYEEPL